MPKGPVTLDEASTSMSRFYAIALAFLAVGTSVYLYFTYVHMFGFWDGYASDLDRAENNLAKYIILIGLGVAAWFLYLAYVAYRVDVRRRLVWTSAVYSVVVGITLALDVYFQLHLMDSAGG